MNTYSFGVEVECFIPVQNFNALKTKLKRSTGLIDQFYTHTQVGGYTSWTLKRDGSLRCNPKINIGVELVSPVYRFNRAEEAYDEIAKVMEIVRSVGGFVNRKCGLHIHIGGRSIRELLAEETRLEALMDYWLEWQNRMFALLPNHRRRNKHCKRVYSCDEPLEDRYKAMNLCSLMSHGTIEFRLFEGTLNSEKAKDRIKLIKAFLRGFDG